MFQLHRSVSVILHLLKHTHICSLLIHISVFSLNLFVWIVANGIHAFAERREFWLIHFLKHVFKVAARWKIFIQLYKPRKRESSSSRWMQRIARDREEEMARERERASCFTCIHALSFLLLNIPISYVYTMSLSYFPLHLHFMFQYFQDKQANVCVVHYCSVCVCLKKFAIFLSLHSTWF